MNARTKPKLDSDTVDIDDPGDADEDKKVLLRRHNLAAIRQETARRKREPVKYFEIEIQLAEDKEPPKIFIGGCEEGDFLITRGRKVVVPESVINRLNDAVVGVSETNPDDPTKNTIVDRKRFAFSVLGERPNPRARKVAAEATA